MAVHSLSKAASTVGAAGKRKARLARGDDAARTWRVAAFARATVLDIGAFYMGALTAIGNAPNVMACAIAAGRGTTMPRSFGYMLWSGLVPLPFALVSRLFVR